MQRYECNVSNNSFDFSLARSSSGVSTEKSIDCIDIENNSKLDTIKVNFFSKFPKPEIYESNRVKSRRSPSQTSIENESVVVKESNRFLKTLKIRRFSDANTGSFRKILKGSENRISICSGCDSEINAIERLLMTVNDIKDSNPVDLSSEYECSSSRNQEEPFGTILPPIRNDTPLEDFDWKDLQDSLIFRAENNSKDLFFSMLDGSGKMLPNSSLSFAKLYKKSSNLCFYLTTKLISLSGESLNVRPGQSVGLIFSPENPMDFLIGFFACVLAKVIAVAVNLSDIKKRSECNMTKKYLNQVGVTVVLTTTANYKELTRLNPDSKEHIIWPDMLWVPIDSFYNDKMSKSYTFPQACTTFKAPLYVEFVCSEQNILRGLPVSPEATLSHCLSLISQCCYTEGQSLLCTEDLRRQTGLWHGVLTALYCGLHTLYMPGALVKKNPATWLNVVTKYKVHCIVTTSRILHYCLSLDSKEMNSVKLSSVTNLLVSDGGVPWINGILDRFTHRFVNYGLDVNALITSISKTETLTICMRRRKNIHEETSLLLKFCRESLSYDIVRDWSPEYNTPIRFFETSGNLLPSVQAIVVQLDDSSKLCREHEIGEICIAGQFSNRVFWMTPDDVSQQLTVTPDNPDIFKEETTFIRTGFVGFFRKIDSLENIYIQGTMKTFIKINGRRFNCDDITSTVCSVKPTGVLHRSRCCVFGLPVMDHNRLFIVVEVNATEWSDSKIYDWMGHIMQTILNVYKISVYGIIGILPNTFPKTLLGDINVEETKSRFNIGVLKISYLILCPQTAIHNLPAIDATSTMNQLCSAASKLAHAFNSYNLASIKGSEVEEEQRSKPLSEILEWRASHTPSQRLLSIIGPKLTIQETVNCQQLHKKAERVVSLLRDKLKVCTAGSVIAIMIHDPIEVMYAMFGCYYAGLVPLVLPCPSKDSSWVSFTLVENIWACKQSKAIACLSSASVIRYLKSKEGNLQIPTEIWPSLIDINDSSKKKSVTIHKIVYPDKELGLIRLFIDQSGVMTLPAWSHRTLCAMSEAHKNLNPWDTGTEVAVCFDTSTLTGVFLNCITSVYCGYHLLVVPATTMETNPESWLELISRKSIKHSFGSEFALSQTLLYAKNFETCSFFKKPFLGLQHVESFVICTSERPNQGLIKDFLVLMENRKIGLTYITLAIDCPWTPGYILQSMKEQSANTIYMEKSALRHGRISEGPGTSNTRLAAIECGVPLPGTSMMIVDPIQLCQKSVNQLGELWLSSNYKCQRILASASSKEFDDMYNNVLEMTATFSDEEISDNIAERYLSSKLAIGDNEGLDAVKTGLIGYVRSISGSDNKLVVLGKLDDVINMRGLRYFPTEIESVINLLDPSIINKSVVFVESDLLIAVIETLEVCSLESCLTVLPKVVKSLLENCLLPLGIVQFVKFGQIGPSWSNDRRRVKCLWLHRRMDSYLRFYCL